VNPLPEYYVTQQDRVLVDFEDLSGQHEVSRGSAPPGVTAGTAISFLQEKDDQYLTPQYQNVEDGFERTAIQTLSLFQQYVDIARKIKVVGADGTFDTMLLSGADVRGGTDIRVEPGSAIGQSMAAKRASIMEMFSVGMIQDPMQALRLMEVGGAQKMLDLFAVAEKKAQRENMRMKMIDETAVAANREKYGSQIISAMLTDMGTPMSPEDIQAVGVDALMQALPPDAVPQIEQMIPPVVQVEDFDEHAIHIETHNKFRMSQEYEALPEIAKEQFKVHVDIHMQSLQQQMFSQMMMGGGMIGDNGAPAEEPAPGQEGEGNGPY
jgi:hypothetical protein